MNTTTTATTTVAATFTEEEQARLREFKRIPKAAFQALKRGKVIPWLVTQQQAYLAGLIDGTETEASVARMLAEMNAAAAAVPAPTPAPTSAPAPTSTMKQKTCAVDGCGVRFTPRSGRAKYCPTHSAESKAKFQARTGLGKDADAKPAPAPTPAPTPAPATGFRAQLLAKIAAYNQAVEAIGILLTALDSGTDEAVVRGFAGSLNI